MIDSERKQDYGLWFVYVIHLYVMFRPSEIIVFNTFYPIYLLALLVIALNVKKLHLLFSDRALNIIFILIFSLLLLSVFNSYVHDFYDRKLLFNWLAWLVVLVAVIFSYQGSNKNHKGLELLAKLVLLIQLCISIIQLFKPDFFSLFWSSVNTMGLDRDVRVSGSLGNPILFSYIVTYLVLIVIARTGPVKNIFWVIFGCLLILMSGSRSLILTYPIIIGAWFYLSDKSLLKRLFFSFICASVLFLFSYYVLLSLKEIFVYSAELFAVFEFESGDENSKELRTLGYRVDYWNAALGEFFSRNFLSIIFGKSGPYLSSPHHDLIYMLSRYGAIGLISYLALNFWLLEIALKNKCIVEGRLLYLTILMSLIVGMANTVGVEMRLGIFSALVAGLLLSRERCSKVISNVEVNSSIDMDNDIKRVSSNKSLPA